MIPGTYLKTLRLQNDLSQVEVAKTIGVHRATYIQLEAGERELKLSEAVSLAELYGLSLDELLEHINPEFLPAIVPGPTKLAPLKVEERHNVPLMEVDPAYAEKFEQVLLYVLAQVGARPNVGETVLCKLLYFIDFDYYEKYEEQLSGATYIKNHFGPTPLQLRDVLRKLAAEKKVTLVTGKLIDFEQKKYLPLVEADLSRLSAQEKAHIDEVITKHAHKSARVLSEYSHGDMPWRMHKAGERIDYESVLYRDPQYSVRNDRDPV